MKSLFSILTAALCLLIATLAILVWYKNKEVDLLCSMASSNADQDRDYLKKLEIEITRLDSLVQATNKKIEETRAETEKFSKATTGLDRHREKQKALAACPEYAPYLHKEKRRGLQQRYGDLFSKLNLSSEQLEQFKELLISLDSKRTRNREIKELIGEDNFAQYTNYIMSSTIRNTISEIQIEMDDKQIPALSKQQIENLQQIHQQAISDKNATSIEELDRIFLKNAAAVLSSDQLKALQSHFADEQSGIDYMNSKRSH